MAGSSSLPPLQNLPQWHRVTTLDKARYPKPFLKDRLKKLPPAGPQDGEEGVATVDPAQRCAHLEKSLNFIKQQHTDLLGNLHNEIERLRIENKDLQFQLVMVKQSQPPATVQTTDLPEQAESLLRRENIALISDRFDESEDELRELRQALRESRSKNAYLQQIVDQLARPGKSRSHDTHVPLSSPVEPLPASTNPLRVYPRSAPPRSPTLDECDTIIKALQVNCEQYSHELTQLKSDLRDVIYSQKWTPDAYLLAKAYLVDEPSADGSDPPSGRQGKIPKVQLKPHSMKVPASIFRHKDHNSLPPLKQTLGNSMVERKKRIQAVQKAKGRKAFQEVA